MSRKAASLGRERTAEACMAACDEANCSVALEKRTSARLFSASCWEARNCSEVKSAPMTTDAASRKGFAAVNRDHHLVLSFLVKCVAIDVMPLAIVLASSTSGSALQIGAGLALDTAANDNMVVV